MSTRSTTHFIGSGGRLVANIYRHSDGYPEGHGADLSRFLDDVEAQTQDTRFGEPSYLAAKLVVWLAREFAVSYETTDGQFEITSHADKRPLDFLSVGIMSEDPGDIEYIYEVDTENLVDGRPTIRAYETEHPEGWDGPVRKGAQVSIPAVEVA